MPPQPIRACRTPLASAHGRLRRPFARPARREASRPAPARHRYRI